MADNAEAIISRLRALMNATGQAIYTLDPRSGIVTWDDEGGARSVLGLDETSKISLSAQIENHLDKGTAEHRRLLVNNALSKKTNAKFQYQLYSRDNRIGSTGIGWFEESFVWVEDPDRVDGYMIGLIRSVKEQKKKEQQLDFLADHDDFTGVLNKRKIKSILEHTVKNFDQNNGFHSYILVGIDRIPLMNSNFGHAAIDEVIFEVARRLRSVLRRTDYLGRVSGTKFGIILSNTGGEEARKICKRLSERIRERIFEVGDSAVSVSVSMGVVYIDTPDMTGAEVFANADVALREARHIGDGSHVSYTDKISSSGLGRKNCEITDLIVSALNERQICLAYQPIAEHPGDIPTKFECLARIRSTTGELTSPQEFIPAAENMGLIYLIDRRVLELAIETLRVAPDIELNVNVSWDTVKDPVWAQGYISVLKTCAEHSSRITIELTETQAIDEAEIMADFVSSLKEAGCKFAIDDFGAGHTSFKSLKFLNVDVLKIDGSFIHNISSNPQNRIFLKTFLDLAKNFRMETVAEWVDNEDDARLVKEMGVKYLQGYLLGKPDTSPDWLAGTQAYRKIG